MRGKVGSGSVAAANGGITPAYAGKRARCQRFRAFRRDHPRVCGEKVTVSLISLPYWGSPPRMRGKVKEFACKDGSPRITPAYAGKRALKSAVIRSPKDHPRVCGEKSFHIVFNFSTLGSPPRMRGKGGNGQIQIAQAGITPAYAGKRYPVYQRKTSTKDHPRVCGEKARTLIVQDEPQGSPPRMRGKD